ncbi:MAG: L-fucose isomerase [Candidatus Onthomonas sp.]
MSETAKAGQWPVIGIRPIIDARQGILDVRGSLEEQTMGMAQAAKALIEGNVRYTNGEPVQVVICSHTIGRVAEAADCARQFKAAGVDITLSVTPCWCYGSETMDMDPNTIKAVWGLNATERPGAVYLASVLAAHARKGVPAFGIYGDTVQEKDDGEIPADVAEKILRFARAAVAVKTMTGKSYLQIGSMCMGISGSMIDPDFFEEYLGMRVESVDEIEVLRRIEQHIYDEEEYQRALAWVKANCPEGFDKNPDFAQHTREQKDANWEFTVKCAIIIKDLCRGNDKLRELPGNRTEEALGHNAIACGFQGQRQWTDYFPNTDFAEAISNTGFDWNGPREPLICATENDTLNGVSMLLMKLLTGRSQMFADVRTCWSGKSMKKMYDYELEGHAKDADGFIHLINSGACCLEACGQQKDAAGNALIKPWYEQTQEDVDACLKATIWCEADLGYFRGGGYSSRFLTQAEMPMTMIRLNIVKGVGPVVQIVEGWSVNLPDEIADAIWKRTDYTWPCTYFAPRTTGEGCFRSAYDVMNHWGANHGAISYGHIGADVITLCSMLRIPVCMHNVPQEKIFRPACWNAYGMDQEGQDYRACAAYGPLYR